MYNKKQKQLTQEQIELKNTLIHLRDDYSLNIKECAARLNINYKTLVGFCTKNEILFERTIKIKQNKDKMPDVPKLPLLGQKICGGVVIFVHEEHRYFVIRKSNYCTSFSAYDFMEVAN